MEEDKTKEKGTTPKDRFLDKLLSALQEFENATGTEIFGIRFGRTPINTMGEITTPTTIDKCMLEIR